MKTTIDLPDDILLKVKVLAAERRTTLKDLIVQGLRLVTEAVPKEDERKRKATMKRLLKTMKATNRQPMTPLSREEAHDR